MKDSDNKGAHNPLFVATGKCVCVWRGGWGVGTNGHLSIFNDNKTQ